MIFVFAYLINQIVQQGHKTAILSLSMWHEDGFRHFRPVRHCSLKRNHALDRSSFHCVQQALVPEKVVEVAAQVFFVQCRHF